MNSEIVTYQNMKLRLTFIFIGAICCSSATSETRAADFVAVPINGLPGLDSSAVAWGDYDGDGLLDVLVTGTTNNSGLGGVSQLWRNTGSGFANVPLPGVPGVVFGSASCADYDNDGRLDFLLTGTTNGILTGTISQLWRNTAEGFIDVTSTVTPGLPQLNQSSVAWGDYDNNGTLDLLISGSSPTGRVSEIWRNNGSEFTNATASLAPGLPPIDTGVVLWSDYDNDGRLDFLIAGETSTGHVAQIWNNTGAGFADATAVVAPELPGVSFSSAAWGDYDNDGFLDFVLTGNSITGRIAQIWRNTGTAFSDVTSAVAPELAGVQNGSTAWGDYDNDGRLDLLITGNQASVVFASYVLRNTGSGFTNIEESLPAVYSTSGPSAAWADYDNDGKLDLMITGRSSAGGAAELLRNVITTANTPPPAPVDLATSNSNGTTQLRWAAVLDAQSGTNVTYNIRVGLAPGGSEITGPQADTASGFRLTPALGNVQLGTNGLLSLAPGVYYWSVQAIDGAFAGGPFAAEMTFTVPTPTPPVLAIARSGTNVIVSWQPQSLGWYLQENASLSPAGWSNSPSGVTNPIVIPRTKTQHFYRLQKP
jgi:hypothetical protein